MIGEVSWSWRTIPAPSLVILVSAVLVLSCGQMRTHIQTESQTRVIAILTRPLGVSNENNENIIEYHSKTLNLMICTLTLHWSATDSLALDRLSLTTGRKRLMTTSHAFYGLQNAQQISYIGLAYIAIFNIKVWCALITVNLLLCSIYRKGRHPYRLDKRSIANYHFGELKIHT